MTTNDRSQTLKQLRASPWAKVASKPSALVVLLPRGALQQVKSKLGNNR